MSTGRNGWYGVRVGDVLNLTNGHAFKPHQWKTKGLPIVRIQNLNNPSAPFNHSPEGAAPEKHLINSGDLLFAWSGTPGTSFGAHIWKGGRAWLNQHIYKIEFDRSRFDPRFLQLVINHNLSHYIRTAHGGAGLAHITKGAFEASEILATSYANQQQLVARVDELFSDLDAGVAALERAKANLARYRAAVLKAAVEGKLTEQWRQEHPDVEPALELLERIREERAELLKRSDGGTAGKPRTRVPGDFQPSLRMEPGLGLPRTWALAAGGSLFEWGSGKFLPKAAMREGPYPVYGGNGINGYHVETTVSHPTFVVGRVGVHCGNVHLVRGPAWVTDNAIVAEYVPSMICLPFVVHAFKASDLKQMTQGGAQPFVSQAALNQLMLPLPPLAEQETIVEILERALSSADAVEQALRLAGSRTRGLRDSILRSAFDGRLTSHNDGT